MKFTILCRSSVICVLFFFSSIYPAGLRGEKEDFIVKTVKVEVPGYPNAYNPSIIRWKGSLLMSFRVNPDPKKTHMAQIGLVLLDKNFVAKSTAQLLNTRSGKSHSTCKSQDARLLQVGKHLYVVYNDNEERRGQGTRRMYVARLSYDGKKFFLHVPERMSRFQGEKKGEWEKNWVPFEYENKLHLAYSISPHRVFQPLLNGNGKCVTRSASWNSIPWWKWGELRGGSPALQIGKEFLAFFHSTKMLHSKKKLPRRYYFFGAYTFSSFPPFRITRLSPHPIIPKGFYSGPLCYHPWGEMRVAFPGGYIIDKKWIWLACGKNDNECWMIKIHTNRLLKSLRPVQVSFDEERRAPSFTRDNR